MRFATVLGLGVLGMLIASPAQALTVSNIDPKPHTVTIKAGSDSTELTIEPDTAVEAGWGGGGTHELDTIARLAAETSAAGSHRDRQPPVPAALPRAGSRDAGRSATRRR